MTITLAPPFRAETAGSPGEGVVHAVHPHPRAPVPARVLLPDLFEHVHVRRAVHEDAAARARQPHPEPVIHLRERIPRGAKDDQRQRTRDRNLVENERRVWRQERRLQLGIPGAAQYPQPVAAGERGRPGVGSYSSRRG